MLVVYLSITGQTRKFVHKLGYPLLEITPDSVFTEVQEPYIAVVPTYEKEATEIVNEFIEVGNNRRNFNTLFGFTAKDLARDYQVPLLHLFEFQGSENDVNKLKEQVEQLG